MCVYHQSHDKTGGTQDGHPADEDDYLIVGVPVARSVNKKKTDGISRMHGFLHCGCAEENALMDFYMWKTWEARDWPGVHSQRLCEGLKDDLFDPRKRHFLISNAYERDARLEVEDFYTFGDSYRETYKRRLTTQIERLTGRLQMLKEIEDGNDNKYVIHLHQYFNHD
jgi:hypothetical protein